MEFFISNPVISFILFILLGFVAYMITNIYNEIVLNKALNIKHQQMRINVAVKGFKARLTGLSVATLVPLSIMVAFVAVGTNTTINQQKEIVSINSGSDIFSIYEDFNERFDVRNNNWFRSFQTNTIIGSSEMELYDSVYMSNSSGSDDYSETNNQVVGVDEMDNVLTDGKYIYTLNDNKVQISLAGVMINDEFDPSLLNKYKIFDYSVESCTDDQFYPQGMLVDDDYLIVIGNQYEYEYDCVLNDDQDDDQDDNQDDNLIRTYLINYYRGYANSSVKVLVFDKSEDFLLQDEYTMSGVFTGVRKIENSLYIVTNEYIPFYLEDINLDDYLPGYNVNGIDVTLDYEDIIYVEGTSPNSFTTFYGINLDSTEVDMEVILGDSGYNLYVSNNNMYLVGQNYYFWPIINEIVNRFTVDDSTYESKTAILKVSIGHSNVEYNTFGLVDGKTLNQFSMDEYNGYLRITTTEGWGGNTNNRLFVLDEELKVVSKLENLGKEREQIKSTRFVGDYAYLVTFEQTDPFYVINLSNPEHPVVEGELIISGYSAYMQPLGENYILGIGYGDNHGGTNGLKIAIFDVSDKTNPVILGEQAIYDCAEHGWGNSTALYNHKDLLVSVEKGIIALPFRTYSYSDNGYIYNSGILVYNFNYTDGLIAAGFVQHDQNSSEDVYVYKSKFISDYFYTISTKYIKVSTLIDVENILYSTDLD